MGSLKARRFFCCVVCSIRTAARFTERERVPMRTTLCPTMRKNFTLAVNSNNSLNVLNPYSSIINDNLLIKIGSDVNRQLVGDENDRAVGPCGDFGD